MKLLIADRDETERAGIRWLVSAYRLGFTQVDEATDIESLLEMIERQTPDVLCVEVEMIPTASWDSFVRTVHRYAHTVVAITTEAVFERATQAIQLHAVNLLVKPLSPDQLKQTMGRIVQRIKRENREPDKRPLPDERSHSVSYESLFVDQPTHLPIHLIFFQTAKNSATTDLLQWVKKYPFLYEPIPFLLSDGIVVLFPPEVSNPEHYLQTETQRLIQEWEERGHGKLTAGIHLGTKSSAQTLHQAYQLTKKALHMRFYRGHHQLLWTHQMPTYLPLDPFLTPEEQREWSTMLDQADKSKIKAWMYNQFTDFPQGYPEPDLLRIRLTSVLAHLRRFMQTYRLDQKSALESRYHDVFQTILYSPVLFRIVQEMLLFTFSLIDGAESQKQQAVSDFIERGLQYIDRHFTKSDLSLEEVASFVGRSPSYFSQVLSQRKRKTFRQYLTETRIRQAKKLLLSDEKNVQEIAYSVGYTDANYFSRVFKETTGRSPRAWRNIEKVKKPKIY